jgi:hypothetical protein
MCIIAVITTAQAEQAGGVFQRCKLKLHSVAALMAGNFVGWPPASFVWMCFHICSTKTRLGRVHCTPVVRAEEHLEHLALLD